MEPSQDEGMGELGTTVHSFDREICVVCQSLAVEGKQMTTN